MDVEYFNKRLSEEYSKAFNFERVAITWVIKDLPKETTDLLMTIWRQGFEKCIDAMNDIIAEEEKQTAAWLRSHEPVTPNTDIKKHIKVKRRTT